MISQIVLWILDIFVFNDIGWNSFSNGNGNGYKCNERSIFSSLDGLVWKTNYDIEMSLTVGVMA